MNTDIRFTIDKTTFIVRSVGILIKNGKILLQHEKGGTEYALPGGTVKFGETTVSALIREWKEETGADILLKNLVWTEESFWEYHGKKQHTIAFYYAIDLADGSTIPDNGEFVSQRDNCDILLGWMPLDEIESITLYPTFAKTELPRLDEHTKHFISRD